MDCTKKNHFILNFMRMCLESWWVHLEFHAYYQLLQDVRLLDSHFYEVCVRYTQRKLSIYIDFAASKKNRLDAKIFL